MWQNFTNLIPTLPDFAGEGLRSLTGGATAKERKNYITDTRKLRKQEYQDMVYSLTEAGLNPVLAFGASPGHASAMSGGQMASGSSAGVGSAIAANRQAGVAEGKMGSEVGRNIAGASLANAQAGNAMVDRAGKLQQVEINQGQIDQIRATTGAQKALMHLYGQQAIEKGASAAKIHKDIEMLDKFGPPHTSWGGIIRNLMMGGDDLPTSGKGAVGKFEEGRRWFNKQGEKTRVDYGEGDDGKNFLGLPR